MSVEGNGVWVDENPDGFYEFRQKDRTVTILGNGVPVILAVAGKRMNRKDCFLFSFQRDESDESKPKGEALAEGTWNVSIVLRASNSNLDWTFKGELRNHGEDGKIELEMSDGKEK